jgi:hypothetical protein
MEAIGIVYDSEISAMRLIARSGGLLALWTDGLKVVGIPEVAEPQAGDFAVILRPTQCGADEAMALFTGTRWATLGLHGLDFGPAEALRIWRP